MIEVEHLTKYYGPVPALLDASFKVDHGEILGFLGPNGAGKTTTMRILAGYMPATKGSARVAGYDVFTRSLEVRRRIGYVPENVPLYNDMTVSAYLRFVASIRGIPRRMRGDRIRTVIRQTDIKEVINRRVGNLSKGFRQRVGLAQALIHDPEVLILDEPTVGLDPKQIMEIRELIRSLGGQRTVLLSTHILPEVSMTCEKVVIIHRGKIVVDDSLENLSRRGEDSGELEVLIGGEPEAVEKTLRAVPGVQSVEGRDAREDDAFRYQVRAEPGHDVRAELASRVIGGGHRLLELSTQAASLEETFVRLVSEEE